MNDAERKRQEQIVKRFEIAVETVCEAHIALLMLNNTVQFEEIVDDAGHLANVLHKSLHRLNTQITKSIKF